MITVKEEFLTDDKTKRAIRLGGYEAVAMWLALKCYCAVNLTDGFIPDEDIDTLPGAPPKPRKALEALVSCGRLKKDGTRGDGLVTRAEHGWELHKYLEHANSREQEERRRERAKARKERWLERRSESVPEQDEDAEENGVPNGVPTTTRTESPVRGRAHAPSPAQPSPKEREEEIPPPPSGPREPERRGDSEHRKHIENFERSFGKQLAHKRPDVLELHAEWRKQFGRGNAPLVVGSNYDDANLLADRIDASGLADCLTVAKHARLDGMVSGRDDDKKVPHESLRYIFGNNDAFTRILRDGRKREAEKGSQSALERMRSLKAQESGDQS